jgi:hypothetical protein
LKHPADGTEGPCLWCTFLCASPRTFWWNIRLATGALSQ